MKKALSIILAAVMMLAVLPMGAAAAEVEPKDIEPRLDVVRWFEIDGEWKEIAHADNWFQEYVKVINWGTNAGSIEVLFQNAGGTAIVDTKIIAPGKQEVFGPIPHNVGTYTVFVRVVNGAPSGAYKITVTDYV